MDDRGLTTPILAVVVLLAVGLGPFDFAGAGTANYFPCPVLRFFEPCPDAAGEASLHPSDPGPSTARPPGPVESLWAEPSAGTGAAIYVPPRPVRELLEAPTPERARAYLAWNQERLRAIARAAEVLALAAGSETPGDGGSRAPGDPIGATGACAVPAGAIAEMNPPAGRDDPLPRLVVHAPDSRRASHGISVLYAFASWCPYSARQTPVMAAWARSRPDVPVTGLLFDSPAGAVPQFEGLPFPVETGSRALRDRLGVRSYPVILFFRDGALVERLSGLTPAARLEGVTRGLGA